MQQQQPQTRAIHRLLRSGAIVISVGFCESGTYAACLPTRMSGPFNFNLQQPLSLLTVTMGTIGLLVFRPRSALECKFVSAACLSGLAYVVASVYLEPPLELVEILPSLVVNLLGWPLIPRCNDYCPAPVATIAVAFLSLTGILIRTRVKRAACPARREHPNGSGDPSP